MEIVRLKEEVMLIHSITLHTSITVSQRPVIPHSFCKSTHTHAHSHTCTYTKRHTHIYTHTCLSNSSIHPSIFSTSLPIHLPSLTYLLDCVLAYLSLYLSLYPQVYLYLSVSVTPTRHPRQVLLPIIAPTLNSE